MRVESALIEAKPPISTYDEKLHGRPVRSNVAVTALITQSLALMQSLTLATLAATGLVQVWHVIAAMLVGAALAVAE